MVDFAGWSRRLAALTASGYDDAGPYQQPAAEQPRLFTLPELWRAPRSTY